MNYYKQHNWFWRFLLWTVLIETCTTLNAYAQISETSLYQNFVNYPFFDHHDGYMINDIYEDHRGIKWLGGHEGLFKYNGRHFEQDTSFYSVFANRVCPTIETVNGHGDTLFIGTMYGLVIYNTVSKEASWLDPDLCMADTCLLNRSVLSSSVDDTGIWLSSWFGISHFNFETQKFKNYRLNPDAKEGFRYAVKSLLAYKGKVWVGNWAGEIYSFDPEKEVFTQYSKVDNQNGIVSEITVLKEGVIAFCTFEAGVLVYDQKVKKFFKLEELYPEIVYPSKRVHDIAMDEQGLLWLGTENGIAVYNANTQETITYEKHEGRNVIGDAIGSLVTKKIRIDRQKSIWAATNFGLYHYHPTNKWFDAVYFSSEEKFEGRILSLIDMGKGKVLIGGKGKTLLYDMHT